MGEVAYVNGSLVPLKEARISIDDRGLLYGDGLFETLRTYHKIPFELDAHLKRLYRGAREIGISVPLSPTELKKGLYKVLQANDFNESVIRITVTAGKAESRNLYPRENEGSIIIRAREFVPHPQEIYEKGVKVATLEDQRNCQCHLKTLNFLPNILARKQAQEKKVFETILITSRGFVTEGSASNVFAVIEGRIVTPLPGPKVLPGVTRQAIINLSRKLGLSVDEDALMKHELANAEEAFLTGTTLEVVPVVSIDGREVSHGRPGDLSRRLVHEFRSHIQMWVQRVYAQIH